MPHTLFLGWLLDLLFGDPEKLPHPIVYMGKWISLGERHLNQGSHRLLKGALFSVISILLVFGISYTAFYFLSLCTNPFLIALNIILQSILVFFCLAGHTLRKEVRMVFEALDRSLDDGRKQVSRIVGRDTKSLSAQEVRTAALETLAENLSDGVIAPLFWYLLLGVPGMLMYKMINTFDSMIGYQNPRYKDFGCWAAHIDDVANYIPARLSAFLILIAHLIYSKFRSPFLQNIKFVLHFGPQHASPNSGWPESALASILDCQFGGSHHYFGESFYKPHIGNNPRLLTTTDMHLSIRLMLIAELIMLFFVILLAACMFFLPFVSSF